MTEETTTENEKEKEVKVTAEVAETDFERFCETNGIEVDVDSLNEEDLASYNKQKSYIVKAIMKGNLVIDEDDRAVFDYGKGTLVFEEPDGDAFTAMDRAKKNEDMKALNLSMAAITGEDAKLFTRMKMRHVKVCMAITSLFLGS